MESTDDGVGGRTTENRYEGKHRALARLVESISSTSRQHREEITSEMATEGEEVYRPQDVVRATLRAMMITGGVGLAYSAVQNSLTKHNVGAWGVFTRSGGVVTMFGTAGPCSKLILKLPLLTIGKWRRVEHTSLAGWHRRICGRRTTAGVRQSGASLVELSWRFGVSGP